MTGPSYHKNWIDCHNVIAAHLREHLHYRCVCGYDTTRPTRDAKKNPVTGADISPTGGAA